MAAFQNSGNRPTDEELRRLYESDSLAKELGINIEFADDEDAPPVIREKVRAFVRKQLPAEAVDEVSHLITGFRPWHEAWLEIVWEENAPDDRSG